MTQDAMTAQVRRWKYIALALVMLVCGYIAGQLTPTAGAQVGATRVQLDTSNCTNGETSSSFGTPRGGVITAAFVETSSSGRQTTTYVYTVCR